MNEPERFILNYNFQRPEFQGVFFGHIYGSTVMIGAKLEVVEHEGDNDELIKKVKGSFRLMNSGTINFALEPIRDAPIFKEGEHALTVNLKMFHKKDEGLDDVEITFDPAFDPANHNIDITLTESNIVNLKKGMVNDCIEDADWHQSCKSLLSL